MRTGFRTFGLAAAFAILITAWLSPYCRTENALNGRFIAGLAAAVAAMLASWTAHSSWARSGRWLALAAIGQSASLQLIDAGILIHYQHYRLLPQAIADPALRWALGAVLLQAIVVVGGLFVRRHII